MLNLPHIGEAIYNLCTCDVMPLSWKDSVDSISFTGVVNCPYMIMARAPVGPVSSLSVLVAIKYSTLPICRADSLSVSAAITMVYAVVGSVPYLL